MTTNVARAVALKLLARMREGRLMIVEDGECRQLGPGGDPTAVVEIHDPRAWPAILLQGSRGLATAYMAGHWSSPDPVGVIRLAARNATLLDEVRRRATPVREPYQRARAALKRNTPTRSRSDIAAHYDLGNALFELLLDPTMMYSGALYTHPQQSLEDAQRTKLDVLVDKLDLQPHHHLLEIGTGWGALAVHAAQRTGCRVTTTTLSQEQFDMASARVHGAGLQDRVTVVMQDYRHLSGTYDRLVSVEMIEAVGWKDLGTFFRRCSDLLVPDGRMVLQAITMDDRAYAVERASKSFIRTLVFPNGCLPSQQVMANAVARETDLRLTQLEDLTGDYARTLEAWRANLEAAAPELDQLGYDERFRRLWRLYLAYCEAGFAERRIGLVQAVYAKPRHHAPVRGSADAARAGTLRAGAHGPH